ncbi:MAG: hypothetical protein ACI8PZ_003848 [Myxococcota bacterium]|jgi:hypothetical protein
MPLPIPPQESDLRLGTPPRGRGGVVGVGSGHGAGETVNPTRTLRSVDWSVWLAIGGCLAAPFYVFPSGNPQPADLLFVLFMGSLLLMGGGRFTVPASSVSLVLATLAFTAWVALVNTWWTGATGSLRISKTTLFYVYNASILLSFVLAYQRYGRAWLVGTVWAISAGLILQVLLAPAVMRWGALRQELFYNNPNQLAYFALLSAMLVFAGSQVLDIPAWLQGLVYLCATALVVLASSRAALAGLGVFGVLLGFRRPTVLLAVGLVALTALIVADVDPASLYNRGLDLNEEGGRGYHRLLRYPHYLILGAGEGYIERFSVEDQWHHELHSVFATLLFCYGIVGAALFALMNGAILRSAGLVGALALVPPYIFGLTHQGLRFTQLWILLGFLACIGVERRRQQRAIPKPADPPSPWRRAELEAAK